MTVSSSDLHDTTNSVIEIPEVGVQLPVFGDTALVCVNLRV